jgi:exopolysaccharide biosynthesis WecB/TagA/CpsF family protein
MAQPLSSFNLRPSTYPVLGVRIAAETYASATRKIIEAATQGLTYSVTALAVHGVMEAELSVSHRARLAAFDLILPDGQPVRWALRWLYGVSLPDRVCGPELMLELCKSSADLGLPVYFYGNTQPVLDALLRNLKDSFPALQIVGARASLFRRAESPHEQETIANEIRSSGAKIVFVSVGCPRQEVWIFENRRLLAMPLVAVGAAFNFHAGMLARAPQLMQKWGLEWLFRLAIEPRRLWRRYLKLNPLYLAKIAAQRLGIRADVDASRVPVDVPAERYI